MNAKTEILSYVPWEGKKRSKILVEKNGDRKETGLIFSLNSLQCHSWEKEIDRLKKGNRKKAETFTKQGQKSI